MDKEREHKFINDCCCEASKYLLLSQDIYPCDYDLDVVDVHEDKEHNLVCLIYVDSDIEEIGSLAFRFTETRDYINGPIYEVFEIL